MRSIFLVALIFSAVSSFGCGVTIPLSQNKEKLSSLQLNQTQQQIRQAIGEPDEVRGSVRNVDGDIVTVWEYDLYNSSSAWKNLAFGFFPFLTITWWSPSIGAYNRPDAYWVYFVNDSVVQWGRAGDWRPDVIMQIRLKHE
jgi:hypothetical protein